MTPSGFWNSVKWRLLKHWFAPRKLHPTGAGLEPDESQRGIWSRLKQNLAWRWLATMELVDVDQEITLDRRRGLSDVHDDGNLVELVSLANTSSTDEKQAAVPKRSTSPSPFSGPSSLKRNTRDDQQGDAQEDKANEDKGLEIRGRSKSTYILTEPGHLMWAEGRMPTISEFYQNSFFYISALKFTYYISSTQLCIIFFTRSG